MLFHVDLVVPGEQGEVFQLVIGQEVAGDEMETPGTELGSIVELGSQQKTWEGRSIVIFPIFSSPIGS